MCAATHQSECCSQHARYPLQAPLQRSQAYAEVDTASQSTRGRGRSAQQRQLSAEVFQPHVCPCSSILPRFLPPATLPYAAHASLAAAVSSAITQLAAAPLADDAGAISMPNAVQQSAAISAIHVCAEQGSRAATWRCCSTPTSSIAARLLACRRSVHCRMCRVSLPSFTLHRCVASPSLHSARSAAVLSALCLVACTRRCWRNLPLACSLRCRHSNTHAGLSFALLK
jgi:hypothetical protein